MQELLRPKKAWSEIKLGELCTIFKGKGLPKSAIALDGQVPCIHYGELFTKYGRQIIDVHSRTNSIENLVCSISGDVLMPASDVTPNGLAVASCIQENGVVLGGDILIIRPRKERLNGLFLAYYITHFKSKVLKMVSGSTVYHLYGSDLKEFTIQIPPLEEQKAIAQVLSDFDNLIDGLEQLIAKKEAIKMGVMQELLRPKEGWEFRRLSEVAEVLDNLRKPLNEMERRQIPGPIPYCGANGVVDYISEYLIDDDIILIAEDGGYFDEYRTRPIAYRMSGKCWVNNHAHILKAKNQIDQGFLFYSLVHKDILDIINGGTRAKLNKGNMVNIPICLPKRIEEQTRIAAVVEAIDSELNSLRALSVKYNQMRVAIMNQLLTGKTRLV